jgi:hypothetical protein
MPLPIFIVLLSMILIAINPLMVKDLHASNNEIDNRTSFGGLSAESTDIAEANNKTDLINGTSKNNDTDFGGLSARSISVLFYFLSIKLDDI